MEPVRYSAVCCH